MRPDLTRRTGRPQLRYSCRSRGLSHLDQLGPDPLKTGRRGYRRDGLRPPRSALKPPCPVRNPFHCRPGEAQKSMGGLSVLNALFEAGLDRSDTVIAFGGGVIGDLAGFAASIYKRGATFVRFQRHCLPKSTVVLVAKQPSTSIWQEFVGPSISRDWCSWTQLPQTLLIDR